VVEIMSCEDEHYCVDIEEYEIDNETLEYCEELCCKSRHDKDCVEDWECWKECVSFKPPHP